MAEFNGIAYTISNNVKKYESPGINLNININGSRVVDNSEVVSLTIDSNSGQYSITTKNKNYFFADQNDQDPNDNNVMWIHYLDRFKSTEIKKYIIMKKVNMPWSN